MSRSTGNGIGWLLIDLPSYEETVFLVIHNVSDVDSVRLRECEWLICIFAGRTGTLSNVVARIIIYVAFVNNLKNTYVNILFNGARNAYV